jgi:threonine/homoserine/homoserine lactone efflux protein
MTGLGIGIALAGAPGPVQAVLLAEAVRGDVGRGIRALVGASLTFGTLLVSVALGTLVIAPEGPILAALRLAGGALLIWLAVDALRSDPKATPTSRLRWNLPTAARGSLAVLLNPGTWLFLGAVASPLFGRASQVAGSVGALSSAVALMAGAALGDLAVVLIGAMGLRKADASLAKWIQRGLAAILAGLGAWLVLTELLASSHY